MTIDEQRLSEPLTVAECATWASAPFEPTYPDVLRALATIEELRAELMTGVINDWCGSTKTAEARATYDTVRIERGELREQLAAMTAERDAWHANCSAVSVLAREGRDEVERMQAALTTVLKTAEKMAVTAGRQTILGVVRKALDREPVRAGDAT